MNTFERFCFGILGERMKERRTEFYSLRMNLLAARIKTPIEAYVSTAMVASYVAGVVAGLLFAITGLLLGLPLMILSSGFAPIELYAYYDAFSAAVFIILFLAGIFVVKFVVYNIFMIYPGIIAGDRKRKIDATLPHAISYIMAMSTAGITPVQVFRLLSENDIYGEASAEASYIVREIDIFGKDLVDALRNTSLVTPSSRMRDFLQGAMACISSGSDITEYFKTKAEQYSIENRQQQNLFLDTLGLISESYTTAMVAGTLFLIILQSIMSVIGGESTPMMLYAVIYVIIPLGSIMFVVLISSMTPEV